MNPRRLISIDALRGIAALVVVLAHTIEQASFVGIASTPRWVGLILDRLFSYGRVGVTLFFLISGFCIHLRWAKAKARGETPEIDFVSFWKQRFIRLYPPYLVALGLYLLVQTWAGVIHWNSFDVYNLVMHLTMLHNFDSETVHNIDGVFWTLAIEEQLYLAYFLLLAMRNRFGWGPTLLACFGGRVAWFALAFVVNHLGNGFRIPHDGGSLAHWFVWALGAVCVEAHFGLIRLPSWTEKLGSGLALIALAIGMDLVSEYHFFGGVAWRMTWLLADPIWGLGLFVLVHRLVVAESRWQLAGSTPRPIATLAGVGLFSYSIYLIHHLVLLWVDPAIFGRIGLANSLANRLLFLPLCLILPWFFFLAFEKPFLNRKAGRSSPLPAGPILVADRPHAIPQA